MGERAHEVLIAAATAAAPVDAGLYGPQPNRAAIEEAVPVADGYVSGFEPDEDDDLIAEAPAAPATRQGPGAPRPATADNAEQRLVAAGLSAALAADIVSEAVAHGLPFAQPRGLKKLIRTALARRLPVMADLGGEARTLAFVGAGGAGKTLGRRAPGRRLRALPTPTSWSSPCARWTAAAASPRGSSRSASR